LFEMSQEFKLLEEDANVFKLVGPVLVKQDLQEARANIAKRMEYIKTEVYVRSGPAGTVHA
jgi:prefoldin beta subunit